MKPARALLAEAKSVHPPDKRSAVPNRGFPVRRASGLPLWMHGQMSKLPGRTSLAATGQEARCHNDRVAGLLACAVCEQPEKAGGHVLHG